MGAFADWDKGRRTGGQTKLHPRTLKNLGAHLGSIDWGKLWSITKSGGLLILVAATAYMMVNMPATITLPDFSSGTDTVAPAPPKEQVREVTKEIIKEVPVEVVKWRTRTVTKEVEVPVVNPVNTQLQESNRILRERVVALEARIRAYDLDRVVNKHLIDKFYEGAYKNGYRVNLKYQGTAREAVPPQ